LIASFAIPGDLQTPTGGYVYDRRLLAEVPDLTHLHLPGGFPFPSVAELAETSLCIAAAKCPLLIDGLAFGVLPPEIFDMAPGPIVALCHHPLGLETGLSENDAARLIASEKTALSKAAAVIVTSATTSNTLVDRFGVSREKIAVAAPGLDRVPRAKLTGDPPMILSVGSVTQRKGHDLLLSALSMLTEAPWRCVIAGSLDRDFEFARVLQSRLVQLELEERVTFLGAVGAARLSNLYTTADLFCLPSRYEGYGMVFAEAMAHGLPIVATRAGAIAEVVPANAGLLAPPEDPTALADMLALALSNLAVRRRMGDASWRHAQTLPGWEDTARTIMDVLRSVA